MQNRTLWITENFLIRALDYHQVAAKKRLPHNYSQLKSALRKPAFTVTRYLITEKSPMKAVGELDFNPKKSVLHFRFFERTTTSKRIAECLRFFRHQFPRFSIAVSAANSRVSRAALLQSQRDKSASRSSITWQVATIHRALGINASYADIHQLKICPEPQELKLIGRDDSQREHWLIAPAARAFVKMLAAARDAQIEIKIISSFRSIAHQTSLIQNKLKRGDQIEAILKINAAPGYSEHHLGRAVDLGASGYAALEDEFEHSASFTWLTQHANQFGFYLSYPRNNVHGISYEPWHWCWHGDAE